MVSWILFHKYYNFDLKTLSYWFKTLENRNDVFMLSHIQA